MRGKAQGVISIETDRGKGDKINLRIVASGDYHVSGTESETVSCGDNWLTYTLTGEPIQVTGPVQELSFSGIDATQLSLVDCASLVKVDCKQNRLSEIIIRNCGNIREIYCEDNALTTLDLSDQASLNSLNCSANSLKSLKVKGCTSLRLLYCYENQLETLDVTDCPKMEELACSINKLTELKLGQHKELTSLTISVNHLRDNAMRSIVNALYDRSLEEGPGTLGVCANWDPSEQNLCTTEDVSIAKGKRWIVKCHDGEEWVSYDGEPTGLTPLSNKASRITLIASLQLLSVEKAEPFAPIHIYSLEGAKVYTDRCDSYGAKSINISLPQGLYLVSVGDDLHRILIP